MKTTRLPILPLLILLCPAWAAWTPAADAKTVIAHRGASGHLPEHTLEAYAFAYAEGADYIEPDLMLTKDGVPIALHDQTLEATTDVAAVFPDRARPDGRFYAIDFTLEEIKQLRVRERVNPANDNLVFPERWPNRHRHLHFRIPTLAEVLELAAGLNHTTGRRVGVYPETKHSNWHAREGQNFEKILLETLAEFGYASKEDPIIIQSFEPESLRRLRELGTELRLVQLIGGGARHSRMVTAEGLDEIAQFADGIGPSMTLIIDNRGRPVNDNFLIREAHARGLIVHPYTMRSDRLPGYVSSYGELLERFLFEAGADGVFTDQTGETVRFLRERGD